MSARNTRQWVRALVDYGAPVAFAVAFFGSGRDFMLATWVLVGASAIALALGFIVERRVAPLPLFAGLLALIFGGLTLIFHDKSFVKFKVTVVNGLLAGVMLVGWALRKNWIQKLFGEAIRLPDAAWRVLMIRYGLWFLVVAVANEIVWRTQSDATWVTFRTALLPAAIVFSLLQLPFMMKHMEKDAPEPPEPGF
ncbi:MAG TPA: inner membrane-spanning protein YciB [Caulobacteraceae bacterium]|nr:inner membrane-spanning protein YciB [Caulobacteraceae bacterium]